MGAENVIPDYIGDVFGIDYVKRSRTSKDAIVNSRGQKMLQFCIDKNLIILNGRMSGDEAGEYTFVSSLGSSVIDFGLTTSCVWGCVKSFFVDDCCLSDHFPIVLCLDNPVQLKVTNKGSFYERIFWNCESMNTFVRDFEKYLLEKPSHNLSSVSKVIVEIANLHNMNFKPKDYLNINNWFDLDCRLMIRNRNRAWRAFKKHGLESYRKSFVLFRSLVKKISVAKKKKFLFTVQNSDIFRKNNKWFWNLCKIKNYNSKVNISLEEWFTYFYSLYGSALPYSVDLAVFNECLSWSDEILDVDIMDSELSYVLSKVKVGSAPGVDGIPSEFWRMDCVFPILLRCFDRILRTGVVPKDWGSAILCPVYKNGSKAIPSNYRGISLLNCVSKIFCNILYYRLITWLNLNNILFENQAGFREKYSTLDNIFILHTLISKTLMRKRRKVYAFFVDLSSAFDTVDRNLMWKKLLKYGISFKFVSLLTELYSIEVNGIGIKILAYADDIVLIADSIRGLQGFINILDKYLLENNMSLNLMKSKVVVFRNGGKLAKSDKWWFRNDVIQVVSQYKYLGVVFKFNGNYKSHIQIVKRNAFIKTDRVIQMCRSAKLRNLKDCLKIFNSIVTSSLLYAAEVWGYQSDELDPVLANFIKRLFGLPRCTPRYLIFMECSLLPLSFTILNKCLNWIFRTIDLDEKRWSRTCLCYVLNKKDLLWSKDLRKICADNGINFDELLNNYHCCSTLKLNYFDNFILDLNRRINNHRREICIYCQGDLPLDAFHVIARCTNLEKIRESIFGIPSIQFDKFLALIGNLLLFYCFSVPLYEVWRGIRFFPLKCVRCKGFLGVYPLLDVTA
ncbi:uncharacterized protein [Centruroides vittatus]|uniref:uncharacterized protein n=1 Tax=Centruroides vittatus TaxID=120091 RepID=UPI00350F5B37